jgi:hypothetical protein
VISPHPPSAFLSKPDFLEKLAPTGALCPETGRPGFKVTVRGRWKGEVERWLWSMGM